MPNLIAERRRPGLPAETVVSPGEAAFVTELSRKTVDQAIDRKEVRPLPARGKGAAPRTLGYPELVYLRIRRELAQTLSAGGRKALYGELRRVLAENPRPASVDIGPVRIALADAVAAVRDRLAQIQRAKRHVSVRPEVRAGEPVVKGTRVPVYVLADLAAQGAPREELLEDYPAVSAEALDAALLYARLYPHRGPRKRPPWRSAPPVSSTTRGIPPRD